MKYCVSTYQTKRFPTRPVAVGKTVIGGNHPLRIQSMTTSKTADVAATTEQIIRLSDAGCDLVRVTVQGNKEALACEAIKDGLIKRGYTIPLVADIHFYPPAALTVVDFVDKVRINPGNFADRRAVFAKLAWDEHSYAEGRRKIEEAFTPLVDKCIEQKKALRIGVNHGSLSDRIMNRYGDTPQGMVESALEFAEVCRGRDFHNFLFSMKSSHPLIMIQAYRLLVAEMIKRGWNYPLHIGLTEAGSGQEGRVKSAMAIGALVLDGLGDTIRVSLTEDPWEEVATCRHLVALAQRQQGQGLAPFTEKVRSPTELATRRFIRKVPLIRSKGSALVALTKKELTSQTLLQDLGVTNTSRALQKIDGVWIDDVTATDDDNVARLNKAGIAVFTRARGSSHAIYVPTLSEMAENGPPSQAVLIGDEGALEWNRLLKQPVSVIFLALSPSIVHKGRYFFDWLCQTKLDLPVVLVATYSGSYDTMTVEASAELGALLGDGYGEGVLLEMPLPLAQRRALVFHLLQAARLRSTAVDLISCPGCGRTQFELQETTLRIRRRTKHLAGVKVAVMGCIVNGPGEMADADFGYVGSGKGKVDLYIGKKRVEKGVHAEEAADRLIGLIKQEGKWVEAPA